MSFYRDCTHISETQELTYKLLHWSLITVLDPPLAFGDSLSNASGDGDGERRVENRIGPIARASRAADVTTHARSDAVGCCAAQCREVQRGAANAARGARAAERQRCVERGATTNPFSRITFFPLSSADGFYLGNYLLQLASSTWKRRRGPMLSPRPLPLAFSFFLPSFFLQLKYR